MTNAHFGPEIREILDNSETRKQINIAMHKITSGQSVGEEIRHGDKIYTLTAKGYCCDDDESPLDYIQRTCLSPDHDPPGLLYIPAGQTHTHTCPGCGKTTVMTGGPEIIC